MINLKKYRVALILGYILLILIFLCSYYKISQRLPEKIGTPRMALESGNTHMYLLLRFLNLFAGMILAVPAFVKELRKSGRFRFDFVKYLILGLPTLIISSGVAFDLLFIEEVSNILGRVGVFLSWLSYSFPRHFLEIFAGYQLLNCVRKISPDNAP